MKKIGKTLLICLVLITLIGLSYLQLKNNKEKSLQLVKEARIAGQFHSVKTIKLKPVSDFSGKTESGFLRPVTDMYVISETKGKVTAIIKQKGDYVCAGEIIAKVEDELFNAQMQASEAALKQLEKDKKRYSKLAGNNAITHQQLEQVNLKLETTRATYTQAKLQLANTSIKAPVNGYINDDYLELGQFLNGGGKVCNVIDISQLKLNVKVVAKQLPFISSNQKVMVSADALPGMKFNGRVKTIAQKAGIGNSFNVEIQVENTANRHLKGGMFAHAKFIQSQTTSHIYIPRQAIKGSLKNANVFVVEGDTVAVRKVLVTEAHDNYLKVLDGLLAGEEIVTEGNYTLYNGAVVKRIN